MCNASFFKTRFILLLVLCGACVTDVPEFEMKFQNKMLILGYIGTHGEAAQVSIMRSVPIDAKEKSYELVSDANVTLVEINAVHETAKYPMSFDGFYYKTETPLVAKSEFQYQLEVQTANKTYKSHAFSLNNQPPAVDFNQTESFDATYKRLEITVTEHLGKFSYITQSILGDVNGFDFFQAMKDYRYKDKKFRNESSFTETIDYNAQHTIKVRGFVIQIPHKVDEFFRQWDAQTFSNEDSEDFFGQMFRVNPGSLKNNFKSDNGANAEEIIGVFFPTYSFIKDF